MAQAEHLRGDVQEGAAGTNIYEFRVGARDELIMKVIGTPTALANFFHATQLFQSSLGSHWLIDSSRKISESCYEFTESENVRHCLVILRAIAVAAGVHIEKLEKP